MSRTYNHRPRWVKLNDPKFPTKERHQHYKIHTEYTGEYETVTHGGFWGIKPWTSQRPIYRQWVEHVPCTIDLPEVSWMNERQRVYAGNREKLCDKRELIWSCPCCTKRDKKKTYNRAMRGKVNQQLHCAVRDFGWTTDADEWYDVDITEKHKSYNEWWD